VADAAAAAFSPTAEWLEGWKARLPLLPIRLVLEALLPKVAHSDVPSVLRSTSLAGVLPPPPALAVRRYQPNEYSNLWLTQVLWGVVYARNQELFDPERVRLMQIMQVT